jgi:hypothetical protein
VKKLLMQLCVLFVASFFYSCGNSLLDFTGNGTPGGGNGAAPSAPETTAENVPKDVTPIYIDTQEEFNKFCFIGGYGVDYPLDGYYILRGNGVNDRIFHASTSINAAFKGTLTGWYMDETQKTTIKISMPNSFFTVPVVGGTKPVEISWLKFEAEGASSSIPNNRIGIVAAEASNTHFTNVTVASGAVPVNVQLTDPSDDVYAGGIVGIAGSGTEFVNCNAAASITVTLSSNTNSKNVYVGGIAGEMRGSVTKSRVAGISILNGISYSYPVTVSSVIQGGTGEVYVGGVAGKLTGTLQQETTVYATVSASVTSAGTGAAYGGGFAGSVESGKIENISSNDLLSVSASSAGVSYAGGLAGKSNTSLTNNRLGLVSIKSTYYSDSSYAGGLVGYLEGSTAISESSATGTVQSYPQDPSSSSPGKAHAGGLAGFIDNSCTITTSSFSSSNGGVSAGYYLSSSGEAKGNASEAYAGGIAGYAKGTISKVAVNVVPYDNSDIASTASAGIDARTNGSQGIAAAGGIVGKNEEKISESYAVVTVKARTEENTTNQGTGASAGGISGISTNEIANTFTLAKVDARIYGTVTSKAQAGGIVGYLDGASASVKTSYAAGWVLAHAGTSAAQAGGIAGYAGTGAAIDKTVALQQWVTSDGGTTHLHRVVGYPDSSTVAASYAYKFMRSAVSGGYFSVSPSSITVDGGDISDVDAGTPNHYTGGTLGWDPTVWISSSSMSYPYPMLSCFSNPIIFPNPPSSPSLAALPWATLLP